MSNERFRQEFSPRRNKYAVPASDIIDLDNGVSVPIHADWIPYILGALTVLETNQYWLGDGVQATCQIADYKNALVGGICWLTDEHCNYLTDDAGDILVE